jgi:NAD(P)-dependent dehydrogenase (short-subunit alcohol dehydrogenase family)
MRAFVVGASSDIGLAVCMKYIENGWSVLAHYRTMRPELKALAYQYPDRLDLIKIDFSDINNLEANLLKYKSKYDTCDSMINCAATLKQGQFLDINTQHILEHITTNTLPGFLLLKLLVPEMTKKGWGRIVTLGSIGVKFGGGKNSFAYSLSKHALEFIPSDFKDWASNNILINVLRLGVVDTRIHSLDPLKNMDDRIRIIPMQRAATPEEVAKAIWFLGSECNSYITGQVIPFSGGE